MAGGLQEEASVFGREGRVGGQRRGPGGGGRGRRDAGGVGQHQRGDLGDGRGQEGLRRGRQGHHGPADVPVGLVGHKPDDSPDFFHGRAVFRLLLQLLRLDGLEGLRGALQGVNGEGRVEARVQVLVAAGALERRQAVSVRLAALGGRLALAVLQQEALPADLHRVRVHFQYLRERDKFVHELLPDHLLDDVLVIIVSKGSAQLVIVHVCFVFAESPQLGHFFRLEQLEFTIVGGPADQVLMLLVQQQLQQELPQRDCTLHTQMWGSFQDPSSGEFLGGTGRKPPNFHADRRLQTVCGSCNEILSLFYT